MKVDQMRTNLKNNVHHINPQKLFPHFGQRQCGYIYKINKQFHISLHLLLLVKQLNLKDPIYNRKKKIQNMILVF